MGYAYQIRDQPQRSAPRRRPQQVYEIMDSRLTYIHENPVGAGWVDKVDAYLYSSASNYKGLPAFIAVDWIGRCSLQLHPEWGFIKYQYLISCNLFACIGIFQIEIETLIQVFFHIDTCLRIPQAYL